ncbi:hypothetical protein F66182_2389 [Fusarium sp. NRRL 66182]|nr:hypothetical protein F66182_2389 [Fusarium sp. NRRL 66182]
MPLEREPTASDAGYSQKMRRDSLHSVPAEDCQSDRASSNDHGRDKNAVPALTRRQKLKANFKRFKWWYLLGLIVFVSILLPILFKIIIPAIIQDILNSQELPVEAGTLQVLTPTQINMSLLTFLDTPLGVKLKPVDLCLHNNDTSPISSFLKLHLPEQHISHKTEVVIMNQTLLVTNETELLIWFNRFFDQPTVELSLQAEPEIHLGALKYNRSLQKTIEIPSLNHLDGFGLRDLEFMLQPNRTKFNIKGHLNIPNSGVLTLGLGNLTFNLESGETRLGLVHLYDVHLKPGDNLVPFDGNFFFQELVPNLSDILDSQKGPLGNGYMELNATGNSTVAGGKHIKYIEGVLNKKHIRFRVPVVTLLTDVARGLLDAHQGSLLDAFGGAVGNATLFEQLLGHWEGGNQEKAGEASLTRDLMRRGKGGKSWMLNLLRLGLRAKRA